MLSRVEHHPVRVLRHRLREVVCSFGLPVVHCGNRRAAVEGLSPSGRLPSRIMPIEMDMFHAQGSTALMRAWDVDRSLIPFDRLRTSQNPAPDIGVSCTILDI